MHEHHIAKSQFVNQLLWRLDVSFEVTTFLKTWTVYAFQLWNVQDVITLLSIWELFFLWLSCTFIGYETLQLYKVAALNIACTRQSSILHAQNKKLACKGIFKSTIIKIKCVRTK